MSTNIIKFPREFKRPRLLTLKQRRELAGTRAQIIAFPDRRDYTQILRMAHNPTGVA